MPPLRATLLAAVLLAAPAAANDAYSRESTASLGSHEGQVLVNQGTGFVPGVAGQRLFPGDIVMVLKQGDQAIVHYDDQCIARATMQSVVKVQTQSPCATPGVPTTPTLGLVPTEMMFVGGALGAAAIGVIIATERGSSP
jgi:hypothetical protein